LPAPQVPLPARALAVSRRICLGFACALILLVVAGNYWLTHLDLSALEIYGVDSGTLQASSGFYLYVLPALVLSVLLAERTRIIEDKDRCKWIVGVVLLFPVATIVLLLRIWRGGSGPRPRNGA